MRRHSARRPRFSPTLRRILGNAADALAANGTGLLITIDELHSHQAARQWLRDGDDRAYLTADRQRAEPTGLGASPHGSDLSADHAG